MGLGQTIRGLSGGVLPAALGHRTHRTGLAADLGTAPSDVNLFRITGGPILLTSVYGKVTTVINGAGVLIQLQHTPTGLAQEVLCAISLTIHPDAVDTIYTITGAVAVALAPSDQVGVSDASMATNFLMLLPGIMNMEVTVATATGVIDWTIHWVPLDFDSRVAPL